MPNNKFNGYQNRNISIAKNKIIDQIYLATIIFGIVAVFLTGLRDEEALAETGVLLIANIFSIASVIVIYLFKHRLYYQQKSTILVILFLFIGIRNLHFFGSYYSTHLFFIFSTLIFTLMSNLRRTIYFIAFTTAIFLIYAILYVNYRIEPGITFEYMMYSPMQWATGISVFLLFNFLILLGVGQYNKELSLNFRLLEERNKKLEHEVAQRELVQYELALNEKKYKSLFENSRDGILLLDSNGKVKECNPIISDISGYSQNEIFSMDVFHLVPEKYRKVLADRFTKLLDGGINPPIEFPIVQKDGSVREVEVNSNLIINDKDISILATIRDISIRKKLEQEKYMASFEAEEKERVRFSKDLHDDLGPAFSTIKLYLETLKKGESDDNRKLTFEKVVGMVEDSVKQIREISHNLSPYLLQNEGLDQAVKFHINKFSDINELNIKYHLDDRIKERLPDKVELIIYRVFLELLNNTVKHSNATEISIYIKHLKDNIEFHYIDNGKGFELKDLKPAAGIGLNNIINRIEAIEGRVDFFYRDNLMNTLIYIPL